MDKQKNDRKYYHAGAGAPIGASLGFLFGMLLFDNPVLGVGIGVALGIIIGARIDTQKQKQ